MSKSRGDSRPKCVSGKASINATSRVCATGVVEVFGEAKLSRTEPLRKEINKQSVIIDSLVDRLQPKSLEVVFEDDLQNSAGNEMSRLIAILKGDERAVMKLVMTHNGRIKVADIALRLDWPANDMTVWHNCKKRLNPKLKKIGYRLETHDGHARLRAIKLVQKDHK